MALCLPCHFIKNMSAFHLQCFFQLKQISQNTTTKKKKKTQKQSLSNVLNHVGCGHGHLKEDDKVILSTTRKIQAVTVKSILLLLPMAAIHVYASPVISRDHLWNTKYAIDIIYHSIWGLSWESQQRDLPHGWFTLFIGIQNSKSVQGHHSNEKHGVKRCWLQSLQNLSDTF